MEAISVHSRWQQSGSQILLMPNTSTFLSLHASSFLPSHCILARTKTNTNLVGYLVVYGLFHNILNCAAFCGAWDERAHLYVGR